MAKAGKVYHLHGSAASESGKRALALAKKHLG